MLDNIVREKQIVYLHCLEDDKALFQLAFLNLQEFRTQSYKRYS